MRLHLRQDCRFGWLKWLTLTAFGFETKLYIEICENGAEIYIYVYRYIYISQKLASGQIVCGEASLIYRQASSSLVYLQWLSSGCYFCILPCLICRSGVTRGSTKKSTHRCRFGAPYKVPTEETTILFCEQLAIVNRHLYHPKARDG